MCRLIARRSLLCGGILLGLFVMVLLDKVATGFPHLLRRYETNVLSIALTREDLPNALGEGTYGFLTGCFTLRR